LGIEIEIWDLEFGIWDLEFGIWNLRSLLSASFIHVPAILPFLMKIGIPSLSGILKQSFGFFYLLGFGIEVKI
jgi:hypothetical protein